VWALGWFWVWATGCPPVGISGAAVVAAVLNGAPDLLHVGMKVNLAMQAVQTQKAGPEKFNRADVRTFTMEVGKMIIHIRAKA
jgi:hypothetical protein